MAYTLDTGHALYGNLVELIGVQSGALVSHLTARTFTPHGEASFGTGTLGEHFRSVTGGYTAKGASISPAVALDTAANPNMTLFVVLNSATEANGTAGHLFGGTPTYGPKIGFQNSGAGSSALVYAADTVKITSTAAVRDGSAHSIAVARTGETNSKLYVDGSLDQDFSGVVDYNNAAAAWDYIGGWNGQGSISADFVWAALFDKVLSPTEISDLHASLGASNAFALVVAPSSDYDADAPLLETPVVSFSGVLTIVTNDYDADAPLVVSPVVSALPQYRWTQALGGALENSTADHPAVAEMVTNTPVNQGQATLAPNGYLTFQRAASFIGNTQMTFRLRDLVTDETSSNGTITFNVSEDGVAVTVDETPITWGTEDVAINLGNINVTVDETAIGWTAGDVAIPLNVSFVSGNERVLYASQQTSGSVSIRPSDQYKQPAEQTLWNFDCSSRLNDDEVILEVLSIASSRAYDAVASTLTFGTPAVSGQVFQRAISAGVDDSDDTDGILHKITAQIRTDQSALVECEFYLNVREV